MISRNECFGDDVQAGRERLKNACEKISNNNVSLDELVADIQLLIRHSEMIEGVLFPELIRR